MVTEIDEDSIAFLQQRKQTLQSMLKTFGASYFDQLEQKSYPFTGLKNLGSTCYLNSTLQPLFFTAEVRQTLQNWCYPKDIQETKCIPTQLQKLFAVLLHSKIPCTDVEGLTKSFQWNEDDVGIQHDISELFFLFLDALDTRITTASVSCPAPAISNTDISHSEESTKPCQYETLSRIFTGTEQHELTCLTCNQSRGRPEPFMALQLPLLEATSHALEEFEAIPVCDRPVHPPPLKLETILQHTFSSEQFSGENALECEHCGSKQPTKNCRSIVQLPNILQLTLNRLSFDPRTFRRDKIDTKVLFPQEFDFSPYCTSNDSIHDTEMFDLYALLVHLGGAHGGHYIAYIRPSIGMKRSVTPFNACNENGENWFEFNDAEVTELTKEQMSVLFSPNEVAFDHDDSSQSIATRQKLKRIANMQCNVYCALYRRRATMSSTLPASQYVTPAIEFPTHVIKHAESISKHQYELARAFQIQQQLVELRVYPWEARACMPGETITCPEIATRRKVCPLTKVEVFNYWTHTQIIEYIRKKCAQYIKSKTTQMTDLSWNLFWFDSVHRLPIQPICYRETHPGKEIHSTDVIENQDSSNATQSEYARMILNHAAQPLLVHSKDLMHDQDMFARWKHEHSAVIFTPPEFDIAKNGNNNGVDLNRQNGTGIYPLTIVRGETLMLHIQDTFSAYKVGKVTLADVHHSFLQAWEATRGCVLSVTPKQPNYDVCVDDVMLAISKDNRFGLPKNAQRLIGIAIHGDLLDVAEALRTHRLPTPIELIHTSTSFVSTTDIRPKAAHARNSVANLRPQTAHARNSVANSITSEFNRPSTATVRPKNDAQRLRSTMNDSSVHQQEDDIPQSNDNALLVTSSSHATVSRPLITTDSQVHTTDSRPRTSTSHSSTPQQNLATGKNRRPGSASTHYSTQSNVPRSETWHQQRQSTLRDYDIVPGDVLIAEVSSTMARCVDSILDVLHLLSEMITIQCNHLPNEFLESPETMINATKDCTTTPVYDIQLQVHRDTPLEEVKLQIAKELSHRSDTSLIPTDSFHCRLNSSSPQIKDESMTVGQLGLTEGSILHIVPGAPSKPGMHEIKLVQAIQTKKGIRSYILGKCVVHETDTIGKIRKLAVSMIEETNTNIETEYIRLRTKRGTVFGRVLPDPMPLRKAIPSLQDGSEIGVQILKYPEHPVKGDILVKLLYLRPNEEKDTDAIHQAEVLINKCWTTGEFLSCLQRNCLNWFNLSIDSPKTISNVKFAKAPSFSRALTRIALEKLSFTQAESENITMTEPPFSLRDQATLVILDVDCDNVPRKTTTTSTKSKNSENSTDSDKTKHDTIPPWRQKHKQSNTTRKEVGLHIG